MKVAYTKEEKEKIIERAKDYMQRKPDAARTKVATYAGISLSVLIRWSEEDDFAIQKCLKIRQVNVFGVIKL